MSKSRQFESGIILEFRHQLRVYGEHLLQGGDAVGWQQVVDSPGLHRVDQVLMMLIDAFILAPLVESESKVFSSLSEDELLAEFEAFAQVAHGCLHELIVHHRDKREFAINAWSSIESVCVLVAEQLTRLFHESDERDQTQSMSRVEEPFRDFLLIASDAGFDFAPDVRQKIRDWMDDTLDESRADVDQASFWRWQDPFLSMLNQVSEGGRVIDEFDCFTNIENQMIFLPDYTLIDVFRHGAGFSRSEVREIIPLMVMHRCEEVALAALDVLKSETGLLSATGLRRLICLRNWIPSSRHAALDALIRSARTRQLQCNPSAGSRASDELIVVKHLASSIDGAGAQTLMTLMKGPHGHKVLIGVVKEHIGWIDLWASEWTTKTACERVCRSFQKSLFTIEVSQEYIEFMFRQGLFWNTTFQSVPHPILLQWVEMLHDQQVNPRDFSLDDMKPWFELEPQDVPAQFQVQQALDASDQWLRQAKFAAGWFEVGDHVEDYLANHFPDSPHGVLEHCIRHVFEPLRDKWSERLARLAFWAESNIKRRGPKSMDFLSLAILIRSDIALEHIPLIRNLAVATLSAYAQKQ